MESSKRNRRLLYWLRVVARHRPAVVPTSDRSVTLLRNDAGRTLRLSVEMFGHMQRRGLIICQQDGTVPRLQLTEAGRAAVSRLEGGEFAAQHRRVEPSLATADGNRPAPMINLDESPLGSMSRLRGANGARWFSEREIAAAERLRIDFEAAMMQPRMTASWDPAHTVTKNAFRHDGQSLSGKALRARDRLNSAVGAVGPELAGAMIDVCCFLKGLERVERERGWPRRSAKLMLKTALGMLDRHYASEAGAPPRASGCIRHWGSEDFRPHAAE